MADQIPVRFQGEGAGTGDLSWGQRELWGGMRQKRNWMPIGAAGPLPAGTTLDDVVADLRFLMSHYPTLRTRLRLDHDPPRQVVAGSGEVPLAIVDADDDADPGRVAERVRRRFWDADYDFASEWPVRMAVVRHRGALTHRVWVMCHLVTDAIGARIMLDELAARNAGRSAGAWAPLEQARWQASPAGARQCERVLRHWERMLRTISSRRFPETGDRPQPRYWNGTFTSAATNLAAHAIAARTGTETSTVLLAVFAIALARVTGINPVVTRVVVSNRFRSGLGTTVSPIVQNGLIGLDVASVTVAESVARARRKAMAAYKYAYYDPPLLDELVARVNRERGEQIDIGCFFNDRRRPRPAGPPPTPEQLRSSVSRSSFTWDDKQDDKPNDPLFLTIDEVDGALAMLLYIDAHLLSPADAEACARGMEAVAVSAALDPGALAYPAQRTVQDRREFGELAG